MAWISRRSAGWRGIPASDAWVCPECLEASDPDAWGIRHRVAHSALSPSYQRPLCSLTCPRCDACLDTETGAAEVERLTHVRERAVAARRCTRTPTQPPLLARVLRRKNGPGSLPTRSR